MSGYYIEYEYFIKEGKWAKVLERAVKNNDIQMFRQAFSNVERPGEYLIEYAAKNNNLEMVEMLVEYSNISSYVISMAVKNKNHKMIELLVSAGKADITSGLYAAIKHNDTEMFDFLISTGAKYNIHLALFAAVRCNSQNMINFVISRGASIDDINRTFTGTINEQTMEMTKYLVSKGANDFNGAARAFGYEDRRCSIETVEYLIAMGAINYNGILLCSARSNDFNMVYFIISKGANDFNGALRCAAEKGNIEMTELMIKHGATNFGNMLVYASDVKMTKFLVEKIKESGPLKIEYLNNALYRAVIDDNVDKVKFLIKLGANDFKGAIRDAVEYKNDEISKLLAGHL